VDDLVIVGRRDSRIEEVQRTPASITSLSGAKLEQQGITNVRELGNIVPNLFQSRVAVSFLNTQLFIRGVGEPDAQGEPSVAVYVDGIYLPKNIGLQLELLDVDRIEIFRGPQGHAFGNAAAAGALLITTNLPSETPLVRLRAAYGSYNEALASGLLSGPIAGDLAGSLALSYRRRDGFHNNVTVGRRVNDIDQLNGRARLRWSPSDTVGWVVTLSGVRDRSTARGVQNLLSGDSNARNQIFPYNIYDQLALNSQLDWTLADALTLRWQASAYGFNQTAFFDNTGDFYGRGSQLVRYRNRSYQTELRLFGDVPWGTVSTGLYYFREQWFTNRRANTPAPPATPIPALIRYRPVYTLIQQNSDTFAAYGQTGIELGRATLTLGARLQHEKRRIENELFNLVAAPPFQSNVTNFLEVINGPPQARVWAVDAARNFTHLSPKAALDYRLTDNVLLYGLVSRGTKSGGFDFRAQTPTSQGFRQAEIPFSPEKVTNYEIGVKGSTADGRLRTNLAAFYLTFDDIQITTNDPVLQVTRRYNAGRGSTRGVELEATATPTDGLQFDLTASWLRARLDRFAGVPTRTTFPNGFALNTSPFAGAVLPNAPEWQVRVAGTWRLPVAGDDSWTLQGDISHQSASFTDTNNNPTALLPDQTYVNAQARWESANRRLSAIVSIRNLFDVQYALPPGYTPAANGSPLYRSTNFNDPRTVLLTLSYSR